MHGRTDEVCISIQEESKPMYFLYVPFSGMEGNTTLLNSAMLWRKNMLNSSKSNKAPHIIVHTAGSQKDVLIKDKAISYSFNEQMVSPNSVIYVLVHGMGDSTHVVNQRMLEGASYLPIMTIAKRMKADGLTPPLAAKLKGIRLFCCDHKGANQYLAYNFALGLGKDYASLFIEYYTQIIGLPEQHSTNNKVTFKSAVRLYDPEKSSNTTPLVRDKIGNVYELLGKASDYKEFIVVGDVLSKQAKLTQKNEIMSAQLKIINTIANFSLFSQMKLLFADVRKEVDSAPKKCKK